MYQRIITGCCFLLFATHLFAQTLFTYGNEAVSVQDFLEAYRKNNAGGQSTQGIQEYLDLYIASRLKIKEARARHYDTLPQFISDLEGLREQIAPSYMNDEEQIQKLVQEAFARSQKDIHAAHIFIPFSNNSGTVDTAGARQRAAAALKELQSGAAFAAVAKKYSADPSVASNGGNIGYITVFTLPYELESIIYNTPSGKLSSLYATKNGYHIFKNLGERKAAGRIKAAQIVLAFPPDVSAAFKQQIKKRADSIYSRLQKGDDFGKLAAQLSDDYSTAAANGQLPEIAVGQHDPAFESVVFSLPKDGAVSKPFSTSQGYYIVKRLSWTPAVSRLDEKEQQFWREKVLQSDRMQSATQAQAQKIMKEVRLQKMPFREAELWAFTDSSIDAKPLPLKTTLNNDAVLLQVGDEKQTVQDWLQYAQVYRFKSDGSGLKPYPQVWTEFMRHAALEYYKEHLEQYNPAFRRQLNEFKEGNLFFEIMQREIWAPAQGDTTALRTFYEKNRSQYMWKESADAVLFYASDATVARELSEQLKKTPQNWKALVAAVTGDRVAADSGRFEKDQIPNATKQPLKAGSITAPVINTADNAASFAYIIKTYDQPSQRSFTEAKGLVVNDYQAEMEKRWVTELKKKYPVVINKDAWAMVQKSR